MQLILKNNSFSKITTILAAYLFIVLHVTAQTVICPTVTNFGPFDCNTIGDVPPQVNTLADAMEIYGIEITGALPITRATTVDSDIIFYCESDTREVIREVVIYNDTNFDPFTGEEVKTCAFTITTVANIVAPTFTAPPDTSILCTLGIGVEVTGEPTGVSNNCTNSFETVDLTFTDSPPTVGGCPGESIFVRTWIATDACGNESEPQDQVITRLRVAPEFTVPVDIIVPCGTDPMDESVTGTVTDAYVQCEDVPAMVIPIIDETQENTPCPGATSYTKKWGAINGCGDATIKSQIIIVDCSENACVTEIPSTVTCPAETNLGTFDCNSIENIPPQVFSLEDAFEIYGIEVANPLPQTRVTTIDSDIIFYCEENAREVIREVIIYNDSFNLKYDEGEEIAICSFTINMELDLTAPVFDALPDTTVTCEQATKLSIDHWFYPTILPEEACPDLAIDLVDSYFIDIASKCGLVRLRSWVAADPCGNTSEPQTQTIIVQDTIGPKFTVPTDITVACGTDITNESITGTIANVEDDCNFYENIVTATIVHELTQFNTPCAGLTTYTKRWAVIDGCGNATTKDQLILVQCPADCTNQDICAGDIVTDPLPGDCQCQLIETQILGCTDPADVNYNAAANCDDGSCSSNDPVVVCPSEINLGTFNCNTINDMPDIINTVEEAIEAPYNIEITGVSSKTRVVSEDSDIISICEFNAREITRLVTIYNDYNSNFTYDVGEEIATCTFLISTEADTEAPLLTAPTDIIVSCSSDIPNEEVVFDDNCFYQISDFANFSEAPPVTGNCPGEKIIVRSWTATDACGNLAEPQTQIITIKDNTGPVFTTPPDITVPCGTDIRDHSITGNVTDGFDECEEVEVEVISFVYSNSAQENTPCPGATQYTKRWRAVDGCGNTTTRNQTIIVDCSDDACATETPSTVTVICPTETNLGTFDCNNIHEVPPQVNSVNDASEVYGIEVTGAIPQTNAVTIDSDLVFYCEANAREVIREVIIYNDNNYNFQYDVGEEIEICEFTITTIPDTEPFVFIAPPDTIISTPNCELGNTYAGGITGEITIDWAVEECPRLTGVKGSLTDTSSSSGTCLGEKVIIRTWTATDPCGNVSEPQTQKITVKDMTGPEFTVPSDITILCGSDPTDDSITGAVIDAYDECEGNAVEVNSNILVELTQENTPCPGSTAYTKRWTAVDDCGNQTTKDQLIVVECPPDCSNQDPCVGDILADPLPGECDCQIIEEQVIGCMDPICPNYDPDANCDIGCSKVFDLALVKEINATEPFTIGIDTVITFTITIYNEGNLTAQNIKIIDYIPSSLNLNDANWTQSGDKAITSIAGPLQPGAAISIDIRLSLNSNATVGTYTNYAEIFGAEDLFGNPGIDIDSTPDMNNENDSSYEDDYDGAEFILSDNTPCNNPNAGKFCE